MVSLLIEFKTSDVEEFIRWYKQLAALFPLSFSGWQNVSLIHQTYLIGGFEMTWYMSVF